MGAKRTEDATLKEGAASGEVESIGTIATAVTAWERAERAKETAFAAASKARESARRAAQELKRALVEAREKGITYGGGQARW